MGLVLDKAIPKGDGALEDNIPEVEVTPEMIEAGLEHLLKFHLERSDDEEVVKKIYRAMERARVASLRKISLTVEARQFLQLRAALRAAGSRLSTPAAPAAS